MTNSASYYYNAIELLLHELGKPFEAQAFLLFRELLNESTQESRLLFSGSFARLHYLCQQFAIRDADYARLNGVRARWFRGETGNTAQQQDDLLAFALFVEHLKDEPIPRPLRQGLPAHFLARPETAVYEQRYQRVIITDINERKCEVQCQEDRDSSPTLLRLKGKYYDWSALTPLLSVGLQLNLLDVQESEGALEAKIVVVEPDHLIDVSSIANCFQGYGSGSLFYPLLRLSSISATRHTLLGNFASQLLDESVHGNKSNYAQSMKRFFSKNALSFATCDDFKEEGTRRKFHQSAQEQQNNLQKVAQELFAKALDIASESIMLEPSFFCEMLGVQGRMDLLTVDLQTLIEQKSGKRNEFTNTPQPSHYVQMLLYMAFLHYTLGVEYAELKPYLLYSRYAPEESLMRIPNLEEQLHKAIMVRNEIVLHERSLALQGCDKFFEALDVDHLGGLKDNKLWENYKRSEFERLLQTIQSAPSLSKSYFYRFHQFLSLEQQLARVGTSEREASGFSAAWQASFEERQQAGNVLAPLTLDIETLHTEHEEKIEQIRLFLHHQNEEGELAMLPNFRVGDIVVFYPYEKGEIPDLRLGLVHRANIVEIDTHSVILRLRAPQTNPHVFLQKAQQHWAIDPDYMESNNRSLFLGLFAFLQQLPHRRALLLNERSVEIDLDQQRKLSHLNPEIDQFVEQALRARDFFLLVGPPGTGKTSVGLMSLVREELARPEGRLLLAAFTNRAVDEICSKLVKDGLPFVRIGSVLGCAEAYRPHLLEKQIEEIAHLDDVASSICRARIVVGTTASLSARTDLFKLAPFSLAIIDEASQLLEPQLLPLLMAEHKKGEAGIGRFVFIGDHKQLPAVVLQDEEASHVSDESLRAIGLTNCRRSFFERLIDCLPDSCVFHFTRHGRMHPEVSAFPNKHFYNNMLTPIPLEHQCEEKAEARVLFYDCPPDSSNIHSSKINPAEARLVVQLALKEWERIAEQGREFDPKSDLGIIVPYRHQVALLLRALRASPHPSLAQVSIDTVERFQGSERETIIYAFTVNNEAQLRFLCNSQFVDEQGVLIDRKLNVALTRSRQRTLIVGNAQLLRKVPIYAALIDETQQACGA